MDDVVLSRSGTPFPKWMTWIILAVGLLLIADGMRSFAFHKLFVGVCCAYASGYRKSMFLNHEGVVRESGTWFGKRREVLPWSEVKFVTLAFRKKEMMAFFERDITGWKVLFGREQEAEVRSMLERNIPDIEVDVR
jgi:hypothetical protein